MVKPRIGARSIGFSVVNNHEELEEKILGLTDPIIQEYLPQEDAEFTCSAFFWKGQCYGVIAGQRWLRNGDTYKALFKKDLELEKFIAQVGSKLTIVGPCNFQLRKTEQGPKIFEINCRFSGTTGSVSFLGFNVTNALLQHLFLGGDLHRVSFKDAHERIKALGKTDLASVQQGDILHWQSDVQYDLIIAMNLIYFFPEPSELIKRLSGFLKPGGQLLLGFRTAGSMQQLPFASFGFRLFEPNEVEDLFKGTGLTSIDTQLEREELETPAGTFSLVNAVVSGIRPSVRALD